MIIQLLSCYVPAEFQFNPEAGLGDSVDLGRSEEIIRHAAHLLPAQGPIGVGGRVAPAAELPFP